MTVWDRNSQARESMAEAHLMEREQMGSKLVLTKLYHAIMESLFALFDIQDMGKRLCCYEFQLRIGNREHPET